MSKCAALWRDTRETGAGGNMVGFAILDASKRMANPLSVEYAVTPPLRPPA